MCNGRSRAVAASRRPSSDVVAPLFEARTTGRFPDAIVAALAVAQLALLNTDGGSAEQVEHDSAALMGALRRWGYPIEEMASVLGVSVEIARRRCEPRGVISIPGVQTMTGYTAEQLMLLSERGVLTVVRARNGAQGFSAVSVIRILHER